MTTNLDTQVVELIGRHRLVADLLADKLEVAMPLRDRGIDLIAYADLSHQVTRFVARPIQMKSFTTRGFGVDRKFDRFADLIIAYVWNVGEPAQAVTYAMSYSESLGIAEAMKWIETNTWRDTGKYVTTSPSQQLLSLLEPFKMIAGRWWKLVTEPIPRENLKLP